MNWTTPTKRPRYFAGNPTTTYDANGLVPVLTCKHVHRTFVGAHVCAQKRFYWVVYQQLNGKISRVEFDRNPRLPQEAK